MGRKMYKVLRPFNHNVVLCTKDNKECILIGKGIGFGIKSGDSIINVNNIEKEFFLVDNYNREKFQNLSNIVDENIIGITEEAIASISKKLHKELNEKIHITLPDHIGFALKRLESGIEIKNVLLHEIKFLYKEEFEAAQEVWETINNGLNVNLPEDEIGFIAMHIHASINNQDVSKSSIDTSIISDMITFIEENINIDLNKESLEYCRMLTHLRFALERSRNKINIKNILIESIKENYKETYDLASKLADMVYKDYNVKFPEGEIGYLTIHIQNILSSKNT
ncbi:PRD domain-containing protein [Clostridium algidicarnis]|uniref:PRD domain-containing protein n=1 Tax=Clostridium algidicarnis TaxID=37659 RepID=UPI001C0C9AEF|nr:PRD domain-containing protein [Clostridium algidicarnis]MBU3194358.1 PRD domain-containing protein [Clostridium algidicarnis]MBU3206378.1 PRD domain-containing protein [Clostridium algidicarnis]